MTLHAAMSLLEEEAETLAREVRKAAQRQITGLDIRMARLDIFASYTELQRLYDLLDSLWGEKCGGYHHSCGHKLQLMPSGKWVCDTQGCPLRNQKVIP